MEFVRKVVLVLLFASLFVFSGCQTTQVVEDPLTLLELEPLPRNLELKKQAMYEPVYGVMRILEISTENGVQTEIMAKKGDIKDGLERGKTGEIAEDAAFGSIIGTFKIVSMQSGFVMCKVTNLTKKIPNNAYIRVQIGQKLKEE